MALSLPPPLLQRSGFSCSSSTSSYSRHLLFQHHRTRTRGSSPRDSFSLRICCSQRQTATAHENPPGSLPGKVPAEAASADYKTKKRRKPRPSFFDQIHDKWALKIGSTREKFPWQEVGKRPQLRKQEGSKEEERGEDVVEEVAVQKVVEDKSVLAPWVHGNEVGGSHLDSRGVVSEVGRDRGEDGNEGVVVSKDGNSDMEASSNDRLDGTEDRFNGKLGFGEAEVGHEEERTDYGVIKELLNDEVESKSKLIANVEGKSDVLNLPWRKEGDPENEVGKKKKKKKKKSNTDLAERIIPEHELKRLRQVALRTLERIKVGDAGVNQKLVETIHEKWRVDEVVKLKFEGAHSHNMRRMHEILESRTGGLVIWRSGSSVVLYRGMAYKLPCVLSYNKQVEANSMSQPNSDYLVVNGTHSLETKESLNIQGPLTSDSVKYLTKLSKEELMDMNDLDFLLSELGPRFRDWSGREPIPVDADLLPPQVPGYTPPFRLLLQGVRHSLRDGEMTTLRRIARTMPPHFALGRNRKLQGLANAMVKLWETSAIAKIAIKRGVVNTCNDRMAEELKTLTGGTLLSRNKDYIVFYRGNDFLPPPVVEALKNREELANIQQNKEEEARQMASTSLSTRLKASKRPFIAGTLAETQAATSRWGKEPSSGDIQQMRRDELLNKHASLLSHLLKKLALAKVKVKRAEQALAKVQENLIPADLPSDLELISDEERFLYRKIGLSMKPFLHIGRREVFDGTIENIHLHWKHRELVKLIVRGKSFAQVKHIAISLEAESGGVLISVDRTTKGYAIILYRGKNYQRPLAVRPRTLLTRRQALARSIELQRREALKHHLSGLQEKIELMKTELGKMINNNEIDAEGVSKPLDACFSISDSSEDEGEEAYLEVYDSGGEDYRSRTNTPAP